MSTFKLSAAVNADKVFLIQKSAIDGRLDPQFYSELPELTGFVKLLTVASVTGGKRLPPMANYASETTDFLYLRVTDVNKDGDIDFSKTRYLEQDTFEFLKRYEVANNELIISIAGTIGRICLVKGIHDSQRAILTENCAKISIKPNAVTADYLGLLLNLPIVQKQIELSYIQTTIPKLGLERIKNLYLPPTPPPHAQQQIIDIFAQSQKNSKKKHQKATALLEGIDAYLLGELGITLPEQDNRLEKRMFYVNSREVTGGRFDPSWNFNAHYRVEGGIYENQLLSQVAMVSKGTSITSAVIESGDYPVIAGGQSSPYSHRVFNQAANVITVSASGAYAGFVWHHDYPIFASDCSVIRSKNEVSVSTLFIAELLKLKQKEIYFLQQGAGQPHVYARDLVLLKLPLPPKAVQREILKHIGDIRNQAQTLQQQAEQILADAKAQVERMILGGD